MKLKALFFLVCILFLASSLRLYHVNTLPPGLYIDEAAIGVNAYSILTKGVDEYGVKYPLWFRSFGDYKQPVYIYLTSLSMLVLGKTELALRFPSVAFGCLTVSIVYLLAKEIMLLTLSKITIRSSTQIALIISYIFATSPWHIQFSRAGFENNVALFLFLLGGLFLTWAWHKQKPIFLTIGSFLLLLTLYTYHSYRITAPFALFVLLPLFFWKKPQLRKFMFLLVIFLFFLCVPFIQYAFSAEGIARFSQTTAFSTHTTKSIPQIVLEFILTFSRNFISFFSLRFLFSAGDGIGRHQMVGFAPLAHWQLVFLTPGVSMLFAKKPLNTYSCAFVIFFLMFLGVLPAAFALPSPHTLRSLLLLFPFCMVVGFGIYTLLPYCKKYRFLAIALVCIITYEFAFYTHYYFLHYANNNSLDWGGGYKQTVGVVTSLQSQYKHIAIRKDLGLSYVYFRFYNENLHPVYVDFDWKKPQQWNGEKSIIITSFLPAGDNHPSDKLIYQTYLPNINHDVFAQFWEI